MKSCNRKEKKREHQLTFMRGLLVLFVLLSSLYERHKTIIKYEREKWKYFHLLWRRLRWKRECLMLCLVAAAAGTEYDMEKDEVVVIYNLKRVLHGKIQAELHSKHIFRRSNELSASSSLSLEQQPSACCLCWHTLNSQQLSFLLETLLVSEQLLDDIHFVRVDSLNIFHFSFYQPCTLHPASFCQ